MLAAESASHRQSHTRTQAQLREGTINDKRAPRGSERFLGLIWNRIERLVLWNVDVRVREPCFVHGVIDSGVTAARVAARSASPLQAMAPTGSRLSHHLVPAQWPS